MACPYFYPVEAIAGSALLPLGDCWKGLCRAVPDAPQPEADCGSACDTSCNFGYARGVCPRFPTGEGPDAVRFAISSHEGATVRIRYVVECDHHPFDHGRLEYSLASAAFVEAPRTATLARQAQAYVESYLRRRKES